MTLQPLILRIINYVGVTQFQPQPAGSELEDCTNGLLDDALAAVNGALQEIHALQPLINMEADTGYALRAPLHVTLTATTGSKTISAFSAYDATWMPGCTLRMAGDDQDNRILSATTLARPYMGATGSGLGGTVYGDCLTLQSNESRAISPLTLPNQLPLQVCDDLAEFLRIAGYPLIVGPGGTPMGGWWWTWKRSIGRPLVALAEGAYDPTLGTIPRRLRFAPMPDAAYALGYRVALNPPVFTRAQIVSPLTTLTVTGAGTSAANQVYTYVCDVAGYRYFAGNSTAAWSNFYHPTLGTYILAATLSAGATPAAYWQSALVSSPLGSYANEGTATGTVVVTTSDSGGGEADPGTLLPIVDAAVEDILLPIALQRFTASSLFKNEAAKKEIARQYAAAVDKLKNSRGASASEDAEFV